MLFYLYMFVSFICYVEGFYVNITSNDPVIIGASVSFLATIYTDNGVTPSSEKFKFSWKDNAIPPHSSVSESDVATSPWSVYFSPEKYIPGEYEVEVTAKVKDIFILFDSEASAKKTFKITPHLNGKIVLFQNGTELTSNLVSSSKPVLHKINLYPADLNFVNISSNNFQSFWYLNDTVIGNSSNLEFTYNYTKYANNDLTIKAILIVSQINTSSVNNGSNLVNISNSLLESLKVPNNVSASWPSVFDTKESCIHPGDNKTVGCFTKKIQVKEIVHDVKVSGNSWLPHGDMLNLTVNCEGSGPFWHCVKILMGEYNSTGLESCLRTTVTQNCSAKVLHYFSKSDEYTLLFIMGNAISKVVTPVRVHIYQVQKHAQLSVIVVPVSCSAIAVILIVFGVAYYIQSRNRYIVEVADFDFAAPSCDTEYKTIGERLREALTTAINRTQDYSGEDSGGGVAPTSSGSVWSPSRKYGSMQ